MSGLDRFPAKLWFKIWDRMPLRHEPSPDAAPWSTNCCDVPELTAY
ncbi:hypothetical protein VTH82DRAFT_2464 [Thermothelomyces myriococcoides]